MVRFRPHRLIVAVPVHRVARVRFQPRRAVNRPHRLLAVAAARRTVRHPLRPIVRRRIAERVAVLIAHLRVEETREADSF